ncbi:M48 family metallopeptidase [Undibacterium sp. Ren11W]|uniref:M48 family metallopeptidase n=1 Tax=Undibacterium sp. Ren11W TaxID=3413045 RepID=UPI003BF2D0C8
MTISTNTNRTAPSSSKAYLNNNSKVRPRAILVLGLWLGFWLLALGLIVLLLSLPFAQLYYRSSLELSGFVAAFAALCLAYALRPRWRFSKRVKTSLPPLDRSKAEPLYAMVEHIAGKLKINTSIDIHLIGAASAFISCERNWYGKLLGLRVGIGLPLLGNLSNAELGSVLAHEFGHFVAGDLALGPWVYRTRKSLTTTVNNLDDSLFFLDLIFRYYGQWVLRLSSSVSRAQEFSADAFAVQCFGVKATRAALEKIHLIEPMWSAYLDHELRPAITRGSRLPVFEGFRRFCKPSLKRPEVQASITHAEARPTAFGDSHPSLSERIAAIQPGASPSFPPLADCLQLVGGELAAETAWYSMFEHEALITSDWDSYGSQILQRQIEQRFANSWMAPDKLPFTELVGMAQQAEQLWEKLRPEGVSFLSRLGKRNHVLEILEEWITASLCHRGFALQVRPGQALLLSRGTQTVQPVELLNAALDCKLKSASLKQYEIPEQAR